MHATSISIALTISLLTSPIQVAVAVANDATKQGRTTAHVDKTDEMFDPSRLLNIVVTMDVADWKKMRYEHHNLFFRPPAERGKERENPYSYYRASVTIDGETVENVGIRKKGFLGSVNAQRPSIKIHFDKFEAKKRFSGLEMMTLNNNDTDGSQCSQFLTYSTFRKAGLPAPRCNFAKVTVNGEYLGVFSNVESVRKRFLKRNFASAKGNLYEGQISDFRKEFVRTFQKKTNKKNADRDDLDRVVEVLQLGDEKLTEALDTVIDLDHFFRYWAVESMVGFWDSYSGNTNNFFIYRVPTDKRFRFIPWGTDGALREGSGKAEEANNPKSVQANGIIPYRLYQLPTARERYRSELRQLLQTVWNEKELLAQLDRIETLIAPHVHIPRELLKDKMNDVREFVSGRREELTKELTGEARPSKGKLRRPRPTTSSAPRTFPTLTCTFETEWIQGRELDALLANPKMDFSKLRRNGKAEVITKGFYSAHKITDTRVVITRNAGIMRFGFPTLQVYWKHDGVPQAFGARLLIDPGFYQVKKEVPVDGYSVLAILMEETPDGGGWARSAWLRGKLKLDRAGDSAGKRVAGRLDLDILTRAREAKPEE